MKVFSACVKSACLSALFASATAVAQVRAPAEDVNLIGNPRLGRDPSGFPSGWCFKREAALKTADVSVPGTVTFRAPPKGGSFVQEDIHLVPGRKYVFGAEVKTSALRAKTARLVVYNYAWTKDVSLYLPEDTDGRWQKVSMEFSAPPTRDELYSFTFYFKGGAKGEASMRAPFIVPASGAIDGEERAPGFSFGGNDCVRDPLPARPVSGERLNLLVSRLCSADVRPGQTCGFKTASEGWVWISLSKCDSKSVGFVLDGVPLGAASVSGGRFEAMRRVPAGAHRLTVKGGRGELVVNSVPTVLGTSYPDPKQGGGAFIDGEFAAKHLLPAFNTFSYGWALGRIDAGDMAELDRLGREIYGHACRWNANTPGFDGRMETSAHLAARLASARGFVNPRMTGLTFDEISASDVLEKQRFTEALRSLAGAKKPIWVWSSGVKYEYCGINADYLSSIAAVSGGTGRLLLECYARTPADEKSAHAYLDDFLDMSILRTEKMVPGFRRAAMIVNGAYTKLGGYCTDCRPEADVKRFLDLYFHRLATSPVMDGLAGIGLYALNNAQEEDLRWTCRLLRHYALEGRKDMLSDKYGYKYNPGLVRNPDFAEGLLGWTALPAADGGVDEVVLKGLAAAQRRKDQSAGGDSACRFRRSAKGPNRLVQRISGLVPGRFYSVRVAVSDAKEVVSGKWNPRRLAFGIEVRGAEDVTAWSPLARYGEPVRVVKTLNELTLVFKACARDAELVFSDWLSPDAPGGPAGEELVFNAVRVKPYYIE